MTAQKMPVQMKVFLGGLVVIIGVVCVLLTVDQRIAALVSTLGTLVWVFGFAFYVLIFDPMERWK